MLEFRPPQKKQFGPRQFFLCNTANWSKNFKRQKIHKNTDFAHFSIFGSWKGLKLILTFSQVENILTRFFSIF